MHSAYRSFVVGWIAVACFWIGAVTGGSLIDDAVNFPPAEILVVLFAIDTFILLIASAFYVFGDRAE